MAADFGLLYKTPLPQLDMGLQVANVGSDLDESALPVLLKLGAGYRLPAVKGLASSFAGKGLLDTSLVAMDLHFQLSPAQSNFFRLRLGAEYTVSLGR